MISHSLIRLKYVEPERSRDHPGVQHATVTTRPRLSLQPLLNIQEDTS